MVMKPARRLILQPKTMEFKTDVVLYGFTRSMGELVRDGRWDVVFIRKPENHGDLALENED